MKILARIAVVLVAGSFALWPAPSSTQVVFSLDERYHVFQVDIDQDSYGAANFFVPVESETPPNRLFTPLGSDPDDGDPTSYRAAVDKGTRQIAIELGPLATHGLPRLELAREIGADVAVVRIRPDALESSPGTYFGPDAAELVAAAQLYPSDGMSLHLSVSPVVSRELALPADLRAPIEAGTANLSDPAVVARFNAILDHIHASLGGANVVSLSLGEEIDRYYEIRNDAFFWTSYQWFYAQVSAHAKSLWGPQLKVGLDANLQSLITGSAVWVLASLNQATDYIGLTYYPGHTTFDVPFAVDLRTDFDVLRFLYPGKTFRIHSTGYPSGVTIGSETKQSQWIHAIFELWDQFSTEIEMIGFGPLHDVVDGAVPAIARGVPATEMAQATPYLGSVAVRRPVAANHSKVAYDTLRNMSFDRGWWRIATPTERPFFMGFTTSPHDAPPDDPGRLLVNTYTLEKLAQDGDLVHFHFDNGVPWVEALADPLQGLIPPYSPNLLQDWSDQKQFRIPGKKIVVSINPTGVPREDLAPYFGYGEGFNYDENFDRIPNGNFADAPRRYPPAPWDALEFNDPLVKIAFAKYALRVLQYFQPDYLNIGIEVSAILVNDPTKWAAYVELHQFLYTFLRSVPEINHIPIMVSVAATSFMTDEYGPLVTDWSQGSGSAYTHGEMPAGVRDGAVAGLQQLIPYVDVLGLSLYPYSGKFQTYSQQAAIYDSLQRVIAEAGAGSLPVAVLESGYPADNFDLLNQFNFFTDPVKQDRHLRLAFYELAKWPNPVEFFVNFKIRDADLHYQRQIQSSEDPRFVEFAKFFRDIGLYDGDGNPRVGLTTWKNHLALPRNPKPGSLSP